MLRVADFHRVPPGDYWYVQRFVAADGKKYKKVFKGHSEAGTQAARIAIFRKANGLPRSTPSESLEDLSTFTCARLPAGNQWCMDTDIPWAQLVAAAYGPNCRTCGGTAAQT